MRRLACTGYRDRQHRDAAEAQCAACGLHALHRRDKGCKEVSFGSSQAHRRFHGIPGRVRGRPGWWAVSVHDLARSDRVYTAGADIRGGAVCGGGMGVGCIGDGSGGGRSGSGDEGRGGGVG